MYTDDTVDRESQQKLYVQIVSILKGKIEKGDWLTGERIPTEDELCRTYDVSKATVRIAVAELAKDGFLRKWQGKGTFVANPAPHMGMTMKTRLTEDMFGEGVRVRKAVLIKGTRKPSGDISAVLKDGDEVYYILSKRVVDDEPAYLEESFVPLAVFPGIHDMDVSRCSFYELIQDNAVRRVQKVIQNIEVTAITGEPAAILNVQEGSPGLMLHRLLVGADGRPIAYTRLFGSGRKYRIQTEFERIK